MQDGVTYGWLQHARSGEWYAARWDAQGKLVAVIGAVTQVERESTDPRDWIDNTVDDEAVLDADWAAGQEWAAVVLIPRWGIEEDTCLARSSVSRCNAGT